MSLFDREVRVPAAPHQHVSAGLIAGLGDLLDMLHHLPLLGLAPQVPHLLRVPACVASEERSAGAGGLALTFEGGGLRASSSYAGITSGLLRVAADVRAQTQQGEQATAAETTLAETGLYSNVSLLSSVSGGSWFAASLAYSDRYLSLVEDMAREPSQAAKLYGLHWTDRWLATTVSDGPYVKTFAAIAEAAGVTWLAQDALVAGYVWRHGFTWTTFVYEMMSSTAGFDMDSTLGDAPQSWAQGKTWLCCHSLVAPTAKAEAPVLVYDHASSLSSVKQTIDGTVGVAITPNYVPAAYSISLGSDERQAPVPYIAPGGISPDARWVYKGTAAQQGGCFTFCSGGGSFTAKSAAVGAFDNFVTDAASLPLVSCLAASSAAFADLVQSPEASSLLDDLDGSLAVWQGSGMGASAFAGPAQQVLDIASTGNVTQAAIDGLAASATCAGADGGFTDTTGIAYAVAAGCTEVIAYLNEISTDGALKDMPKLFSGPYTAYTGATTESASPVFAQAAQEIMDDYAATPGLAVVPGATVLTGIKVYTWRVTTVENPLWGIPSGIEVVLHIVGVASNVEIGGTDNFHLYDSLAQETIQTITSGENSKVVQETVLPWFAPSAELVAARAGGA